MQYLKKYSTSFTLLFIGVVVLFTSLNVKWGDDRWHSLIRDDARGYYAYLPAVFIYDDLSFAFYDTIENDKYYFSNFVYDYRYTFEGKVVNKYFAGTALAQMPFFLIAHLLSESLDYDSDGYSKIYWVSIAYAAIFYMLLGLYFISLTLRLYQVKKAFINIILLVTVFGTHLHYYTSFEPGMSHVFSFAFVSWFIFATKSYFIDPSKWRIFLIAALIGMITLIRPVNALVIFLIPFLAGSFDTLKSRFSYLIKKQKFSLLLGVFMAIAIAAIQLIIYKIQSDHYLVYSYGSQGFNFLDSHMIDILFSYKKGLFLYTPLIFVSLFGGIYLYKKNKYELFTLLFFFLLITYVLASWWSWYYGGSFSSRVYVEFLPVFAILLSYLFKEIRLEKWRNLFIIFLFLLVVHNQKQTYLYRVAYIHYVDMTKEKYWDSLVYPVNLWYYEVRNNVLDE